MLLDYIREHWKDTIHHATQDNGTLIGLPNPYTVPVMGDEFPEMYYWDTYFTNKGLILSGYGDQAKNNVDNLLYLLERYGYVPNGNRIFYLTRSQPPVLYLMVDDVYQMTGDHLWLAKAYRLLTKEYAFFQDNRMTPIGLNRYSGSVCKENASKHANRFRRRTGLTLPEYDDETVWKHYIVFCESGWDVNPRWGKRAWEYVQPDLNSLLYGMEKTMSHYAELLGLEETQIWKERYEERGVLMRRYLKDHKQIYQDYNYYNNAFGSVESLAFFYPIFVGLASDEEAKAAVIELEKYEYTHGLVTCLENGIEGQYQWDYPNGWPPLHYFVIQGLLNYGYKEVAYRIANKWVKLIERMYDTTGQLWEKYNVVNGSLEVINEYDMPPMMGWTAGVYVYCKGLLSQEIQG